MTLVRSLLALPIAIGLMTGAATAQSYPDRLVRIIVPQGPAGPTDLLARVAGQRLQAALGQNVIIENRPGAGGVIAAKAAGSAEPDGGWQDLVAYIDGGGAAKARQRAWALSAAR